MLLRFTYDSAVLKNELAEQKSYITNSCAHVVKAKVKLCTARSFKNQAISKFFIHDVQDLIMPLELTRNITWNIS